MSGVRDPKDFPQTPGVEGIKALSQGLGDGLCLPPVEQDWEDVSPVEVHLSNSILLPVLFTKWCNYTYAVIKESYTRNLCQKFDASSKSAQEIWLTIRQTTPA